jgi:hypothetical protein
MNNDAFTPIMGNRRGPLTTAERRRREAAVNTYSALLGLVQIRDGLNSDEVQKRLDKALQCAQANAGGRPDNVSTGDIIDFSRDALREAGLELNGGRLIIIDPS